MREMTKKPEAARMPGLGTTLLLGALTATGALATDMYLPAIPGIAADFGEPAGRVQSTMSAFFLGMALGQLVYGPLSDRIGRRKPLLAGTFLACVGAILSGLSQSANMLIASRFLESLGCCAGVVVARAIVGDRYGARDAARVFSTLMLVLAVAPLLAPTLGATLLTVGGWRFIFAILAVFAFLLGVAVFLRLTESRSAEMQLQSRRESVWQSYSAALSDRRVLGFVAAGACNGGAFFTYLAGSAVLFIQWFGLSPRSFAIIFALNALGLVLASQLNRLLLRRYPPHRIVDRASIFTVAIAGIFLLVALFGMHDPWIATGLLFLALSGYGLVTGNSTALALSRMPQRSGAISALIGASVFGFGAVVSAASTLLPVDPPVRIGLALLLGLAGTLVALRSLARVQHWS